MLAQVVAALIRHMAMSMGPFGAILAGAAPGIAMGMFSAIPSYATGTSNHPGGMALVGEQGPELVNLPRGSSVYTNSESMGMMGGKVEFEIRGEKLYGVLRRYTNRQTLNG
jgi:phage-related tail protein